MFVLPLSLFINFFVILLFIDLKNLNIPSHCLSLQCQDPRFNNIYCNQFLHPICKPRGGKASISNTYH